MVFFPLPIVSLRCKGRFRVHRVRIQLFELKLSDLSEELRTVGALDAGLDLGLGKTRQAKGPLQPLYHFCSVIWVLIESVDSVKSVFVGNELLKRG